ncbi:hypothetical protein [Gordonia humi]|uniref:TobH protein n=1 Tax=Gordonia humi TaxID=686429 RepID=A0A840F450_9ACTN|nr:hypothetical protein [Gordonia humi]MBB4137273.1 hypothetical protein [Gordonia humi]
MSAHLRDLDDVDGFIAADRDGLLRAAATSGAHVRAVAHAVSEGVLAPLEDLRPRAVVIVTGSSTTARQAAEFVIALLASRIDVPLVVAPALPGWIGPLDVVVVVGDDPGDRAYADAALRAVRRRAELVAAVPVEGPLADAVGTERVADLSPRLPADTRFSFVRLVAALVAVCAAFRSVRLHPAPPALHDVADALDAEATADHPAQESFHNQAKLLAMRADDPRTVFSGDTPASTVLAERISTALFTVAGIGTAAVDEAGALARLRLPARSGAAVDPIFYDPDFDDAPPQQRPRIVMATTVARRWSVQQRTSAIGDVDVVTEQAGAPDDPAASSGRGAAAAEFGDSPTDLTAYLTIAVRADFAAAYLELTGASAR